MKRIPSVLPINKKLTEQKYLVRMHLDQRENIMNPRNIKMVMKFKILYLLMKLVFQLMITSHGLQNKDPPPTKPNTKNK